MKKLRVFGISLFILSALFLNLVSSVKINEVSPKTPEFVEIYNENNEILNLSEWEIKDKSNSTNKIVCSNISNCSLITNATYFLILGKNTNISDITNTSIIYFYVDDETIANRLDDKNESIIFFNSTFSTNFSWENSTVGKSWQLCNDTWIEAEPTPGLTNYCIKENESDSESNEENEKNESNEENNNPQDPPISLELEWEEEIVNGEEFEVNVEVFNLKEETYDIKIYISFKNNNTIISETYHEENNEWKSSFNYVYEIFSGPGNKSEMFLLRIKEDYKDFYGNAVIGVKIREDSTKEIKTQLEKDIEILKKEDNKDSIKDNKSDISKNQQKKEKTTIPKQTNNIIRLESKKTKTIKEEEKVLYESKTEKIKKYAVYGLNLVLIAIIILMIKKKI